VVAEEDTILKSELNRDNLTKRSSQPVAQINAKQNFFEKAFLIGLSELMKNQKVIYWVIVLGGDDFLINGEWKLIVYSY